MTCTTFTDANEAAVEYDVVMQFARILRLQAKMLEEDGEVRAARALRQRAARSVRDVLLGR